MLRKLLLIVPIVVLALSGASGMAAAAPGDPYPPEAPVAVNVGGGNISVDSNGNAFVVSGNTFDFSGVGFVPLEGIDGTISSSGPSGLRHAARLDAILAPARFTDTADASGNFSHAITIDQTGTYTLTAVGRSSGRTALLSIAVVASGSTPTAPATTTVAGAGAGSASGGGSGSGLAYTGTSIVGPLAVGMIALLGGLTLLVFGTRGVRIRRRAQAH